MLRTDKRGCLDCAERRKGCSNAEQAACERAARAEARLAELEQRRTGVDDWRRRCWTAEDERDDVAKRLARALLERDHANSRAEKAERERAQWEQRARFAEGELSAAFGLPAGVGPTEGEARRVLDRFKRERDEALAKVDEHARQTMASLKRAQTAERERDEARREAEKWRTAFIRAGWQPASELPWKEGGDEHSG